MPDLYFSMITSKFIILLENKEKALQTVKELDLGNEYIKLNMPNCISLEGAMYLHKWGLDHQYYDESKGNVTGIYFEGLRIDPEETLVLFKTIAPFVESGSYIAVIDEHEKIWRWLFSNNDVIIEQGRLVWDSERVLSNE